MFRYDTSSGKLEPAEMQARPVMLDRWTGKTYFYYSNASGPDVTGAWQEMGPRAAAEAQKGMPWEDYIKAHPPK